MTGAVLVAVYLAALACFLGLDILSKVPPTLYALVLAALGALASVSVVGGLYVAGAEAPERATLLGRTAFALAVASGVGGTVALGRLLVAFSKKKGQTP